jgi:hypothetical protein
MCRKKALIPPFLPSLAIDLTPSGDRSSRADVCAIKNIGDANWQSPFCKREYSKI